MSKQIRLVQVERKLNVGRNTIIEFLQNKGYDIDSNPNTKIDEKIYEMLENAFEDSAVEKKVASNIKIGLEEKKAFSEKVEDKRITVLVSEISAVQIYEKTSSGTSKRPGFSLQN